MKNDDLLSMHAVQRNDVTQVRVPYRKPELQKFGSVAQLTMAGATGSAENISSSAPNQISKMNQPMSG
jgi:hypothetical protein